MVKIIKKIYEYREFVKYKYIIDLLLTRFPQKLSSFPLYFEIQLVSVFKSGEILKYFNTKYNIILKILT